MWRKGSHGRWRAVCALLAVAGAQLFAVAPAAAAEGDRLLLSVDGALWVRDVTTPIYDPTHLWVPGDSMTYTVLFRNESGEPAQGFGELKLDGAPEGMFESKLRLDDRPWVDGPRSEVLDVAPGQVVRLQMELTMLADAPNPRAQVEAPIAATVTLRGGVDDSGTDAGQGGPGGGWVRPGPGWLATTGASVAWLVALAAIGLAVGAALFGAARRRRTEDDHGTCRDYA